MSKSRDAFRTISEVSDVLDTPAHVLRFWESKFSQVKPVKRAGGRRYYRPNDVDLLSGIKKLLHDDGMTIKGVQKLLREQGVKHVSALGTTAMQSSATPAVVTDTVAETPAPKPEPAPAVKAKPTPKQDEADVQITNVVTMPSPHPKGPALSLSLAPKSAKGDPTSGPTPTNDISKAAALDIPADPSDKDSKAPARLFHILHKVSHDKLATQAKAIAPLLARMQVLRDSINLR